MVPKEWLKHDGYYSFPAPTEYGKLQTDTSGHLKRQTEWSILGMMASPQVVYLSTSTVCKTSWQHIFCYSNPLTNERPLPILGAITKLNKGLTFEMKRLIFPALVAESSTFQMSSIYTFPISLFEFWIWLHYCNIDY